MSTHIEPFEAMDSRPWKIVNTCTFLIMNGRRECLEPHFAR